MLQVQFLVEATLALQAGDVARLDDFLTEVIEADRLALRAELEAIQGACGEHVQNKPPAEIGEYLGEWCGSAERDSPLFTPIPVIHLYPNSRACRGGQFFESADRLRSAAREWGSGTSMGRGGFRVLKEIRE